MDFLQLVLLGLLQGVAEWLPISSKSQVMLLLIGLFKIDPSQSLSLSIFLHIGTVIAASVYFRDEIVRIARMKETKLLLFLFLSTLATGIVGLPLFMLFRKTFVQSTGEIAIGFIGAGLVVTGVVFLLSREKQRRSYRNVNVSDSIIAGLSQSFSVLPGVSRSGMTTASLLFMGFSQEDSVKLSMLMSIPAVIGAEIGFSLIEGLPTVSANEALILISSSFIFGFIALALFLKLARRINFGYFCVLLGLIALIPLLHL